MGCDLMGGMTTTRPQYRPLRRYSRRILLDWYDRLVLDGEGTPEDETLIEDMEDEFARRGLRFGMNR